MTKDEFIIRCAIGNMNGQFSDSARSRNPKAAVDYAEKLWEELAKRGYVDDHPESMPVA
ncbi:hypothetical protein [Thioalkalivibrio thiocyanodenitrificans]|uniref:hypothetical protein n=1 Tax=Thioalkalivibrio thiocyanodenitrificans TaxID=243063 RepID=UPI0018DE3175|nr:hypothetical protein [Thioalkalivibrio thiocyanodenitrificans]